MGCIDFSQNPPVFGHPCEGDDRSWTICPRGAIEITETPRFDIHDLLEDRP